MNETVHPARSTEFLSSLHDGEVGPAERLAFDAHRASCAECREAASAFERTLAAFRSTPTAPPAADLSARILRKIRAQSPSRRPFGVMFGIDIRWAGALLAALIAVLMSAPVLLRRPSAATPVAPPPAIRARIVDAPAEVAPADRQGRAPALEAAAPEKDKAARQSAAPLQKAQAAAPSEPKAPSAGLSEENAVAPAPRRPAARSETTAAEAGAAKAADGFRQAGTLSVRAIDEAGPAPAVASQPADEALAALRGREFVVVVEPDGRVREIASAAQSGLLAKKENREPAAMDEVRPPPNPLLELRFAPGDRARRLVVRVE